MFVATGDMLLLVGVHANFIVPTMSQQRGSVKGGDVKSQLLESEVFWGASSSKE